MGSYVRVGTFVRKWHNIRKRKLAEKKEKKVTIATKQHKNIIVLHKITKINVFQLNMKITGKSANLRTDFCRRLFHGT